MEYKKTLNLPKTDFPMRANLAQMEPQMLKFWDESSVYDKAKEKNVGNRYTLHDGPPYANGRIHIGHALNKVLKDVVIKYKTLRGFHAKMIPGWDCHGLPVELQLLKKLKKRQDDVEQIEFRKQAAEYALAQVDLQKEDFQRLGCWAEWDDPYLTLNPAYEGGMLDVLADLVDDGYIYRGLRPVNWCVDCHTALAEAEVEYADKISDSIYFRFRLNNSKELVGEDDVDIIVWTTTPWTLLSNVGVAFSPKLDYVLAECELGKFIFAESLIESLSEKFLGEVKVIKKFKADILEKQSADHPFVDRNSTIVLAEYVSAADGSGCVHIAPGHGADDFAVGKQYGLETIMPINDKGVFENVGEYSGIHVTNMNPIAMEAMEKRGTLLKAEKIEHSYPHCWRCKKPLMFRATEQWFLNVNHNDLKGKILDEVDNAVKWVPEQGHGRFRAMVQTRPDWCLSRQRLWGVPIPALKCTKCDKVELSSHFIRHLSTLVREAGTNIYFEKDLKELLPEGYSCACGSSDFEKGKDILDVWFESGVSFNSVLNQREGVDCPSDLYLEGSDQHRGWFQVSMINSVATTGKAPYKAVLTHGFVVDGEGRKMSKSVGNVIAPQTIINKYGAEVLRLWTIFSDYRDEVRVSDEILKQLSDAYRKIRNTVRFVLGNLDGFAPKQRLAVDDLLPVDRYVLSKLAELSAKVEENYDEFSFYKLYHDIYDFCNQTLSSFYLDILKDKLYTYSRKSHERISSQTVLWYCADFLIKAIAPFMCFTAEQAYNNFDTDNKQESVFLSEWSSYASFRDSDIEERIERLTESRDVVFKALEEKRTAGVIGSSLEAQVKLMFKNEREYEFYKGAEDELRELFIVSAVDVQKAETNSVKVELAQGEKCPRCWNVRTDIGSDSKYTEVCSRCARALNDLDIQND